MAVQHEHFIELVERLGKYGPLEYVNKKDEGWEAKYQDHRDAEDFINNTNNEHFTFKLDDKVIIITAKMETKADVLKRIATLHSQLAIEYAKLEKFA